MRAAATVTVRDHRRFAVGLIASLSGSPTRVRDRQLLKMLRSAVGIDIPPVDGIGAAPSYIARRRHDRHVVSAFMPARRAGRVPPVAAMRTSPSIGRAPRSPGWSPVRPCWPQGVGALVAGLSGSGTPLSGWAPRDVHRRGDPRSGHRSTGGPRHRLAMTRPVGGSGRPPERNGNPKRTASRLPR